MKHNPETGQTLKQYKSNNKKILLISFAFPMKRFEILSFNYETVTVSYKLFE